MLPDDPRNLLMLWRASVRHHVPRTRDALLRLTATPFQQVFDPIQLLFYLATPPPEIDPHRLTPCPAKELISGVFIYDGSRQNHFFQFKIKQPYYAPITLSVRRFGLLFLERLDQPLTSLEQQWIDLIAVHLADHLNQIRHIDRSIIEQPPPLFIDREYGQVWVEGQPLWLSQKERTLLLLLAEYQGRPCSRELIRWQIYPGEPLLSTRREDRLDLLVSGLRRKLQRVPNSWVVIKTIRGVGYQLDVNLWGD